MYDKIIWSFHNDKEDNKVLKLKELDREEAIEVFQRYEEDKDKIVY